MAGRRKSLEQRRGYGSTHNRTQLDERMAMEANEEDEYDDNEKIQQNHFLPRNPIQYNIHSFILNISISIDNRPCAAAMTGH